jgi:hypothetical protein
MPSEQIVQQQVQAPEPMTLSGNTVDAQPVSIPTDFLLNRTITSLPNN